MFFFGPLRGAANSSHEGLNQTFALGGESRGGPQACGSVWYATLSPWRQGMAESRFSVGNRANSWPGFVAVGPNWPAGGMAESRFSRCSLRWEPRELLAGLRCGWAELAGRGMAESRFSRWARRRGMAECRFSTGSGRGRIRNSRRSERVQRAADSSIEPDWRSESVCRRIPRIR